MELISVEELVEDDASCGQTVIRIVLVVGVAELICADSFSAQSIIFGLDVGAADLTALR